MDASALEIVVVDDSNFFRSKIIKTLEEEGFTVIAGVETAERAVELLSTTSANLFIIDVVMPKVNGLEIAKFIAEHDKEVFVIMMSSLNVESILIESITNGAVDYLQKPFEEKTLIKSVWRITQRINKG